MIKIAVFGFYCPDDSVPGDDCRSPVNTSDFMRVVWEMEPVVSRVGRAPDTAAFVKLTDVFIRPVYVQALSDKMASSAGLLKVDGYIAIIDAVKVLAPNAIRATLRRLSALNPNADLIIAAGRQNEPEALSSDELREVLGLSDDLLIMPYVPDQPKTVTRIIRRLVRYIDNPKRVPPPIFAGDVPLPVPEPVTPHAEAEAAAVRIPRIRGLAQVRIAVRDLERSVAFYHDVLGFRLLGYLDDPDGGGQTVAHLDSGRGVIELVPVGADQAVTGPGRLALRVDVLDALIETLASAGVVVIVPPVTSGSMRRAVIADPDGTQIALIEGDVTYPRR